jgi:hypothetical protein
MRTLAAMAAGAHLDAEQSYGGDLASAERWFENEIHGLLNEVSS